MPSMLLCEESLAAAGSAFAFGFAEAATGLNM